MRILFVAPIPPPVTGHSLASQVLAAHLAHRHTVDVVDLSEQSTNTGGVTSARVWAVAKVLWAIARRAPRADVVYLTVSESVAGNVKDLAIYLLCAGRLSRTFIHLHGGSIGRLLFDRYPTLRRMNAFVNRRLGGVIVCGPSHVSIFSSMIAPPRVHVIPNFAADDVFVSEDMVIAKFAHPEPLRVLFLGSMIVAKGYLDLLRAVLALDDSMRARLHIDFAGRFDSLDERTAFERDIAPIPAIQYHGEVHGAAKRTLLANAHVFCLPSTMLEGQPIAILEAYAAGCVVLATGQPGIRDVFEPGVNGLELCPADPASIAAALAEVAATPHECCQIGLRNHRYATAEFRRESFTRKVASVLEAPARRGRTRPAGLTPRNS